MMDWRFTALAVLLTAWTGEGKEWCDLGTDHTMCKITGPSASCKIIERGLNDAEKQTVLDKHNELRRKAAKGIEDGLPEAANMKEMVYSEDLALVAQRWADQCELEHDSNRKRCDGTNVGQNIFESWDPADDTIELALIAATRYWHLPEGVVYKPYIEPYSTWFSVTDNQVLDYVQMVWADSEELGCGAVGIHKDDGMKTYHIVCNYAVEGSIMTPYWSSYWKKYWKNMYHIYKAGDLASECPAGYSANDGLCKKDSAYSTEECEGGEYVGGEPVLYSIDFNSAKLSTTTTTTTTTDTIGGGSKSGGIFDQKLLSFCTRYEKEQLLVLELLYLKVIRGCSGKSGERMQERAEVRKEVGKEEREEVTKEQRKEERKKEREDERKKEREMVKMEERK